MVRAIPFTLRLCLAGMIASYAAMVLAAPYREGALKIDPSDDLFTNAAVRHLSIEIDDEGMATLRLPVPRSSRNQSERPDVPATVREGNHVWTNVAVHLKGSFGSFRPVNSKPALTLNFDKLAAKQRFHGLQKISLNNSVQDLSYTTEKICREIYTAAGVPVPRADYATVELNGRQLGLFVLAEGWNKQFLRRYFANVKGNFYDLGSSRDISKPVEAASGENPTNHAALLALLEATHEPNHVERLERLRQTLDLDRLLTLHALDVLMWNWDGYGLNRNNFRIFHDQASDRIVFFPHGLDQMFWKANAPIVTVGSGMVMRSILETSEGRSLYLKRFEELRTNIFDVRAVTNRVVDLARRLQPALEKEGRRAVVQQQSAAAELTALILARERDVDEQLTSIKSFVPLKLNATVPLTNWISHRESGQVGFTRTTNSPLALRIQANNVPSQGLWTTTVWLEGGRYRVEGRVKTLGVQSSASADGGAGFRIWSSRKDTRGVSWSWFPYSNSHDPRTGGLIPVTTTKPQQRLSDDTEWTVVTHEFELRQPLADVQIQCTLQASAGAAWFDLSSLKIRRTSLSVSPSGSN